MVQIHVLNGYHGVHLLDGILIEAAGFAILSATQQICLSVSLILCTFCTTDTYNITNK
jgi:hypothetical protein